MRKMVEIFYPHTPPPQTHTTLGMGSKGQNSTFAEYGHVAYQIKWNQICSNLVANILLADPTPLT